jgi:hypothetical protein
MSPHDGRFLLVDAELRVPRVDTDVVVAEHLAAGHVTGLRFPHHGGSRVFANLLPELLSELRLQQHGQFQTNRG